MPVFCIKSTNAAHADFLEHGRNDIRKSACFVESSSNFKYVRTVCTSSLFSFCTIRKELVFNEMRFVLCG